MRYLIGLVLLPTVALADASPVPRYKGVDVAAERTAAPTGSLGEIVVQNSTKTAKQIYDPQYPGRECATGNDACGYFTVDGVRSVLVVHPGSRATNTNGFGAYVSNQSSVSAIDGREGGNSVGFFSNSTCEADGSACWGINTTAIDAPANGRTTRGTGKKLIGYEADFSPTSANTVVQGIALMGSSMVQPAAANGYSCGPLGGPAKWTHCFIASDNTAQVGIYLGTQTEVANSASATADFYFRDDHAVRQMVRAQAAAGLLQFTRAGFSNGVGLGPGVTGDNGTVQAVGTDADVGLNLQAKGKGGVVVGSPLISESYFAAKAEVIETQSYTPPSSTSPCVVGRRTWDASHIYVCVATNTWRRVALSAF